MDSQCKKYRLALRVIQSKVSEQSDNDDIWAIPVDRKKTVMEKYLQYELKALHDVIELHTIPLLESLEKDCGLN